MGASFFDQTEHVTFTNGRSAPMYVSYWLRLETAAQADWEIYGQWHGSQLQLVADGSADGTITGLEPIVSFGSGARAEYKNKFVVTWRSVKTNLDAAAGGQSFATDPKLMTPLPAPGTEWGIRTRSVIDAVPFPANVWTHIASRVVFAKDGTGEFQVWRDGRALLGTSPSNDNPSNTPVGYNENIGPAFNHGIYASPTTFTDAGVATQAATYTRNIHYSGIQWGRELVNFADSTSTQRLIVPNSSTAPSTIHLQSPRV